MKRRGKQQEPRVPGWLQGLLSADGLFVTDAEQRILVWSQSAEKLLGRSAQEALGRRCFEVVAGKNLLGHPTCRRDCPVAANAQRGRATPAYDVVARRGDGERVWLNSSILLVPSEEGGKHLLVHVVRPRNATPGSPLPDAVAMQPELCVTPIERPLSRREIEVLRLIAYGQTPVEVAASLTLSSFTVRNHIASIQRKLGARNRVEMILLASRHQLI